VADYSAQAVVNVILSRAFPKDPIVGEEDAQDLQRDGALANRIAQLANEALTSDLESDESADWGIGPGQTRSVEEVLEAIGRGNYNGGPQGRK
jgi:3'(2'), 5'-bisphosphate nucleotidase